MNTDLQFAFSRVQQLRRVLLVLLWITAALAPIAFALDVVERTILHTVADTNYIPSDGMIAAADSSDRNHQIAGLVILANFLASSVVWFMWIFRSNKLALALGAVGMNYTPGWSVGWFFIPIANLFKPYFAMKEVYLATMNPTDFTTEQEVEDQPESLNIIKLWWLCYIVDHYLAVWSGRLTLRADTIEELFFSNSVSIASAIGSLVAAIMTIWFVREFTDKQDKAVAAASAAGTYPMEAQTRSV